MRRYSVLPLLFLSTCLLAQLPTIEKHTEGFEKQAGYFDFYYAASEGKIYLEVERLDEEFLYVNSLTGGVGSNDIGLDRNQLGDNRVVKFIRSGNKLLLLQPNYGYRAVSDNVDEQRSVTEAFAQSVLGGFTLKAQTDDRLLIDLTPFLLRDAHGVGRAIKRNQQGNFSLNRERSALWLERTKNFPQNTEFDALLTFTGNATGRYLRQVTPSNEAVTVRQHHSFVELPDADYQPRVMDPRSGYFGITYQDYATPIGEPLTKRFIVRHRLEKKNPTAERSEAVEPIVYYLDRGAPEPVRSALLEGARWWNQAFEAAGYIDAFRVEVLPEGADPMDVRYNVINWVHRRTRGWSYGSSVIDPRTGEILKGHVLLGSLRVRQDYLLAQGLLAAAYNEQGTADPRMLEMALARLRQLSAHEVGHTLGIAHNFAASTNGRASVMDYPHPYVTLKEGELDFSQAYDTGIGAWDKQVIKYGYGDFPAGTEAEQLDAILRETRAMGLRYLTDADARPLGSASPSAHLWDNGESPTTDLARIRLLRNYALNNLDMDNLPPGVPAFELERVLSPVYLMHRYQTEAVAKLIGGVDYEYGINGTAYTNARPVPAAIQNGALTELLNNLTPGTLRLPTSLQNQLAPPPPGYGRDRETFRSRTAPTFDPLLAAEGAADQTLGLLLQDQRLERIFQQGATGKTFSLADYLRTIRRVVTGGKHKLDTEAELIRAVVEERWVVHLLRVYVRAEVSAGVKELVLRELNRYLRLDRNLRPKSHLNQLVRQAMSDPASVKLPPAPKLPDGSPIGCGH